MTRWNHRRTTTDTCIDCESRPVLCYGRCGACFKRFQREKPKLFRALRKMGAAQRKIEIEKMRAEKRAQRTPAWEYENPAGEAELAAQFGQDSK